ncbi:MAG: alpha/beta fold hydrolase [Gammaproteobacteria bacterium]
MSEPLPVFALHGWALNAAVFAPLLDDCAGRWVVTPDLPGHGSKRNESLGRDPGVVARRLLEEAPARAIWLGWSLGGLLSLAATLAAPERVAALVLVASTPCFVARPDWPAGMPRVRLEAMAAELARDPAATVDEFLTWQVHANTHGEAALRGLRTALAKRGGASPEALADGLALLEATDYRDRLAGIELPVLVIAGGRDRLVRPAAARATVERLPAGRLAPIAEAGHAPFLSHPIAFRVALADFLHALSDA